MSIPLTKQVVHRSLGARHSAMDVCTRILTGAVQLKSINEAQRNELIVCLNQEMEMNRRIQPVVGDVYRVVEEYEKTLGGDA